MMAVHQACSSKAIAMFAKCLEFMELTVHLWIVAGHLWGIC